MKVIIKDAATNIFAGSDTVELMGKADEVIQVLEALGYTEEPESEIPAPITIQNTINENLLGHLDETSEWFQQAPPKLPELGLQYLRKAGEPVEGQERDEELEPDWREIDQRDLRVGDVVRVMIHGFTYYEQERTITGLKGAGRADATINGTDTSSPICTANVYSSVQVDMNRRGPAPESEEPQETFEFEEIAFEDIEQGDYIRSTYERAGAREGVARCYDGDYIDMAPDWSNGNGTIVAGELGTREMPTKIERRFRWEPVSYDDIRQGDVIRAVGFHSLSIDEDGRVRTAARHEPLVGWYDEHGAIVAACGFSYKSLERKVK